MPSRATFTMDLHIHTRHSGDTDADPVEMIEAAIACGLDGIAITEHSSYEASDFAESLRDRYAGRLLIVRGVEFSAREGHCLVFGVNTDELNLFGAPAAELLRVVLAHGGVMIPAHPFRGGSGVGSLLTELRGITAVEGYNGANLHTMNVRAMEVAHALALPCTGGSDAHSPSEVGKCLTHFPGRLTQETFLPALRAGEYHPEDLRKISRMMKFPLY